MPMLESISKSGDINFISILIKHKVSINNVSTAYMYAITTDRVLCNLTTIYRMETITANNNINNDKTTARFRFLCQK